GFRAALALNVERRDAAVGRAHETMGRIVLIGVVAGHRSGQIDSLRYSARGVLHVELRQGAVAGAHEAVSDGACIDPGARDITRAVDRKAEGAVARDVERR